MGCISSSNCYDPNGTEKDGYAKVEAEFPLEEGYRSSAHPPCEEEIIPNDERIGKQDLVWVEEEAFKNVGEFAVTLLQEEDQPKESCFPWGQLFVLWVCCSLASGILPGQSRFVKMFAESGVLSSACSHPEFRHCPDQTMALEAAFVVGRLTAYSFFVPIGLLYDRWGARVVGTLGAVLCALGLLLVSSSVFGAASGHDATTAYVFFAGVLVCDFGSMLNSFSLVGLVWQFPGKQTTVIGLIYATYQSSAFLPLFLETGMNWLHLPLSYALVAWTSLVFGVVFVCSLQLPTKEQCFEQAKRVLTMPMPLPAQRSGAGWCKMLRGAVAVLEQHQQHHSVSAFALAFAFAFAGAYSSLVVPYAEELLGDRAMGEKLREINQLCTLVVGMVLGPLVGGIVDRFGLQAFPVLFSTIMAVALATVGLTSWSAQVICTSALALFVGLFWIFVSAYVLLYSPPNRFGAVQGMYTLGVVLISTPWSMAGSAATSLLPAGANEYRIPLLAFGTTALFWMLVYAYFFKQHPPPVLPPLLPDDEAQLAVAFGCSNLHEVCEITRCRRSELIPTLGSSDPEALQRLLRRIDTAKMLEMMNKRPAEDIIEMLQGPILTASFHEELGKAEPRIWQAEQPVSVAESFESKCEDASPDGTAVEKRRPRIRGVLFSRILEAAGGRAMIDYLLQEPVDAIWTASLGIEDELCGPRLRDKELHMPFQSKDFVTALGQRPELKKFIEYAIVGEIDRRIATLCPSWRE